MTGPDTFSDGNCIRPPLYHFTGAKMCWYGVPAHMM